MATRNVTEGFAPNSRRSRRWGKWSWLVILCLSSLTAWFWASSGHAQQGPPLNLPEPVIPAPPPPAPVDAPAPLFTPDQPELIKAPLELVNQPETLKQPKELPKPPTDLSKPPTEPFKACPPGARGPDGLRAIEQCDQNLPGIPCPSPSDLQEQDKYIKEIVDPKNPLTIYHGRTRLLILKQTPTRIQIGDPDIVDYAPIGNEKKEISLIGKKLGSSVLYLWFTDPADRTREAPPIGYLVRVVPDPDEKTRYAIRYQKLTAEINCAFPDSKVCLYLVGDKLVVQGQAKDIADATQILRIARSNAPRVEEPKLPIQNVSLALDASSATKDRLRDLLDVAGPYVINLLRIPGEQQVMLKVTVAEINRSAARSIGLNFTYADKHGNRYANTTGNIAGSLAGVGFGAIQGLNAVGNGVNGLNQTANNLPMLLDNGRLSLAIDALRTLNYARTLAEPTLTTLNGQPAKFQAGGSFPIPITTAFTNQITATGTQFQPYGVQLSFTPYITDRDRIRLSITAEISTRDISSGALIGNTLVPGLTSRNFQDVVELRHGETLAVAGMIQNNLGAQANRIPFFGDLPIIGRVLGFDQINAGEQELVVLITPVLVHPLTNAEIPPLPGSDLFEPGDLEFYLLGRLESRRSYDYRSPVRTDLQRMLRYHRCEELYIFGPSGHSEGAANQPAAKDKDK